MGEKFKAAAAGGAAIFVLSLLTIFMPVRQLRLCCCLWSIAGGALAAYLYVRKSATPVRAGDGALLGALAGVAGGLPLVSVFLAVMFSARDRMMAEFEARMTAMGYSPAEFGMSLAGVLLLAFSMIFLTVLVLSTVGGLIGVPLFEKRKGGGAGAPPLGPPPPPDFSATPGGGYGAGG